MWSHSLWWKAAGHGCLDSLEKLESDFQAEHFFTKTGILQMVCERTSTPKNTLLQNSLLAWVVQGLTLRALTPDDGKLMHLEPGATRVPWKFVPLGFFLGGAASFERCYLQVFFLPFCFSMSSWQNHGRDRFPTFLSIFWDVLPFQSCGKPRTRFCVRWALNWQSDGQVRQQGGSTGPAL